MDRKTSTRRRAAEKLPQSRSKAMMQPLVPARADEISLDYHLTLEVLRRGVGTHYHIGSMAQAIYMAMLLSQREAEAARQDLFRDAEDVILRCRKAGLETGIYVVDKDAYTLLGEVLTLFDQQLAVFPVHELMKANERLKKIFSAANAERNGKAETS